MRELVYEAIRHTGARPESGRAAMLALANADAELAATFDGSAHGPAPIVADEPVATGGAAPTWLVNRLKSAGINAAEQKALIGRAPLDLRINALRDVDTADLGEPITGLPQGRRLPSGTQVDTLDAYRDGVIEVQDAGSQFVTMAAQARPGQRIVDLCAGAGGKTLALAATMCNEGKILASDTDRARLSRLAPRAERAGVSIVETRLLDPGHEAAALADWAGSADGVLIDAPCSGTGTWRRNPEARWRLSPVRLDKLVLTQRQLLGIGAKLVKPGGALVYIVCSLLDEEGAGQVAAFLASHPDWSAEPLDLPAGRAHGPGVRLTPAHDATDGFFVARLKRAC